MGVVERSREVMAVVALHEALRNVCISSDWTYSVFWTIRPRPRLRGGLGCKAGDEGSLMLMWEDGYCRPAGCCSADAPAENAAGAANNNSSGGNEGLVGMHRIHSSLSLGDDVEEEDPVRKAFRRMSIQLYNYGEGLMGKVASDKCHKWVFRESSETEAGPLNYWQSSFDSHPPEWTDQFSAGIQTIAVIQAGHGLLQLGSCKIVAEDLHFVLRMRYTFESLENQAGGGFLSQTFAPMRNRFFCGTGGGGGGVGAAASPGPVVSPSVGWQNGHATYYQTSSDFRLRLGVSNDPAAAVAAVAMNGHGQQGDDNSITSLRLSLQNGSPGGAGADRSLGFDFRGDHAAQLPFSSGVKRSADGSSTGAALPGGRSNLLARRMQYSSNVGGGGGGGGGSGGHSSFQELLQSGNNFSTAAAHNGVFLNSNGVSSHHDGLMVQIPPVIAANNSPIVSPLISPGGTSHKVARTASCMSPTIQAALQEALERSSRGGVANNNNTTCSSPLAARLSKLTESQYSNGNGCTTPKPSSSEAATSATPPQHYPGSGSHPSTPSNKDNYLISNNGVTTTTNGCFMVDHSSAPDNNNNSNSNSNSMVVGNNGGVDAGGGATNHIIKRGDPLHIPAAAWENLKESLDVPRRASGEMYSDFMEGFFE